MFSPLLGQFCELFDCIDCITLFEMSPQNFQQGNILSRQIYSSWDAAGRKVNSILGQKIMLQHENHLLWMSGNSQKGRWGVGVWKWLFEFFNPV
jgi:hypothetical protein